jgi:hypothetical protein
MANNPKPASKKFTILLFPFDSHLKVWQRRGMTEKDFDSGLGTLLRQAIHNGIPPHGVIGIMEFHKAALIKQMVDNAPRAKKPSELVNQSSKDN